MNPAFLSLHEGLYVNPTHFHPLSIQEFWYNRRHANVAQSVEQTLRKRPVGGSIPFVGFYFLSAILLIMKSSHANSKDSRTNQKNGIRSLYISETIYLKAITKIQAETGREIYLPVAYRNQPPKEESKRTRLFHKAKSAYQAAVFVQPGNTINCVQNL